MAITLGELKSIVIRLLADEVDPDVTDTITGKTTPANLLRDSIQSGLRAILPWAWKPTIVTIPSGTTVLELPSDVYRVEGVYDLANVSYLNELVMAAGVAQASDSGNAWLEYPDGYLTFLAELTDGGTLYYSAQWAQPVLDEEAIQAPAICVSGIAFYAASYCLLPKALSTGTLGQYKMKVDSGVPTDNPILDMSNAFMKRFELEMSRIAGKSRGVKS